MEAENQVLNDEDVLLPSELKELNENAEEKEKITSHLLRSSASDPARQIGWH